MLSPLVLLGFATIKTLGGWVLLAAERGQPAKFGAPELATYAREAVASALMYSLAPFGRQEADFRPRPVTNPPILLVPGYTRNRSSMWFLKTFLEQRGFTNVHAMNHISADGSLAAHAEKLSQQVETLLKITGAEKVDIVAHSLGGLVVGWYLKHREESHRVRRFIAMGVPWKGTRTAVFARGATGQSMLYGTPMLDGLTPPPVPTVAIWSPDDPLVVPSLSASPPGLESVCIEGAGHVEMLTSARVFRAVQAALSTGDL